jgi:uncharacterized cupin superfamily protein
MFSIDSDLPPLPYLPKPEEDLMKSIPLLLSRMLSLALTAMVLSPAIALADDKSPAVVRKAPLKLDPEKLAGHGLESIPPWPAEALIDGESKHWGEVLFRGDVIVEVYEAVPSTLKIVAPYDEFIYILEGKLIIKDLQGHAFRFEAGDRLVVPKGFEGTWQTLGRYRELIVVERKSWEASASADGKSELSELTPD